jgi:hypothetical protein
MSWERYKRNQESEMTVLAKTTQALARVYEEVRCSTRPELLHLKADSSSRRRGPVAYELERSGHIHSWSNAYCAVQSQRYISVTNIISL